MIKGPKDILILMLAALCFGVSLIFLPWAELNFTGHFPDWLSGAMTKLGVAEFFTSLAQHNQLMDLVKSNKASGNWGDYAYSLFLFLAITASAIATVLIGKEDNSEKTVLEAKK